MAAKRDRRRWALRIDLDGDVRRVPLEPGETTLGSLDTNTVVLAHGAVSKRHAVLRSTPDGFEVEDLGSKNGTLLDGRPVRKARFAEGSVLSVGPIALRLEKRDEDDLELGLDFGPPVADSSPPAPEVAPPAATVTDAAGDRWLLLVGQIVHLLASGEQGGVPAALEALREGLGAAGVALLDARDEGEPSVVAVKGDPGLLEHLDELHGLLSRRGEPSCSAEAARPLDLPGHAGLAGALRASANGRVTVLVASGGRAASSEARLLYRVVLDLVASPAARRGVEPAIGPSPASRGLVFPPGYVPGRSEAMRSLHAQLRSLVSGDLPVLVTGETGVGKEHVARILHDSSPTRRSGPFQAVNCAAVPSELLEAELFGVEKGAATGVLARPGQFQLAHKGVIFLDEIGEMPIHLQAKLLRVLQSLEVTPVGGRQPVKVDVRILAATNGEPELLVREGRLRQDLYYRIAGWTVRVPALRERRDDIPVLVEAFVRRFSAEEGRTVRGVSLKALRLLVSAPWPGNVRQLEHEVRRLVHLCPDGGVLDASLLPLVVDGSAPPPTTIDAGEDLKLQPRVDALERRLIEAALARTDGHRSHAAELLGISRNGLTMKLKRLGIED